MNGETKSITLQVRCTAELVHRLDEYRRRQPDIPSRAEAARRCLEQVLAEDEARAARGAPGRKQK